MTSCIGCWCAGIRVKRALHFCQKSPTFLSKEPYITTKCVLYFYQIRVCRHSCEKSPLFLPKEPTIPTKRALYSCQMSLIFQPKEVACQVRLYFKFHGLLVCRHSYQKSAIFLPKEPYIPAKRDPYSCQQRLHVRFGCMSSPIGCWYASIHIKKSPIFTPKKPCIPAKRDPHSCQKSPIFLPKETGLNVKSDWLLVCKHSYQKSPIFTPKEPYIPATRDPHSCQKSPIFLPKEPYISAKRDRVECQVRFGCWYAGIHPKRALHSRQKDT